MAKGIIIESGSPRTLELEGVEVAQGGTANQAGLYAVGSKLYLDGEEIADAQGATGLLISDGEVTFNGKAVGDGDIPTPPTPPIPSETELWIPPMQNASERNKFTYRSFIEAYDELMSQSNYQGTINKYEYQEVETGFKTMYDSSSHTAHTNVPIYSSSRRQVAAGVYNDNNGVGYGSYPLYHYEFTPANYTKTFYVQACIHGNEHDGPQTLLRIMDIVCNHTNETAYARLKPLRDNVRWIVVPVVSPWGHDNSDMNVPYTDWDGNEITGTNRMNMNRNMDVNHDYPLAQVGTGGNYPFQRSEVRHIKFIIDTIGAHNIDYAVDNHDGEGVDMHFWINYNADGANAPVIRKLLDDLISYEEELIANGGTDYRHTEDTSADVKGWVHPNVADAFGYSTGICAAWFNGTTGMLGSVCEYIGGYFGYSFSATQMTRSLRIRANLLIYAYEMIHTKGWLVNEDVGADYFHFDYPVTMTREGLRKDGTVSVNTHGVVLFDDVYKRWDALMADNPTYISKSTSLGQNFSGDDVYSYTLGNGAKKVLFIGGTMRFSDNAKETEFGIYLLCEYLCNPNIVSQSEFLTRLRNDYTIVVLPCIDIRAGGNSGTGSDDNRQRSLNNPFAGQTDATRWKISNGKCVPYNNSHLDVNIFKSWIDSHSDALVLLSGGERKTLNPTTGDANLGSPSYEYDYMTQVIVAKNVTTPSWLDGYCSHLVNDRGEDEPDVEHTAGLTCGDYAFDNHNIPAYFVNLKVSQKWAERQQYMQSGDSAASYMYRTYETGRRIANIVNIFLMAGGDIADGGGLVNKND